MTPLRIVFMGTPDLARTVLERLLAWPGATVPLVVTQPDRPKGRKLDLHPSPVKELALARGIEVAQPARARAPEFLEQLRDVSPQLIVVAAYGQILPSPVLELPPFKCLNVHTSLLPKYRGAGPIQWAILNGDSETGVTIMQMEAGLDTGPIVSLRSTPITAEDNAQTLHDRLAHLGGELLIDTIPGYVSGALKPQAQDESAATHARKLTREDGHLDWTQPAVALWNRSRAFTPWPGTYCYLPGKDSEAQSGRLIKVWETRPVSGLGRPGEVLQAHRDDLVVACGEGALALKVVQLEGGRRLTAAEFLTGHPVAPGARFS